MQPWLISANSPVPRKSFSLELSGAPLEVPNFKDKNSVNLQLWEMQGHTIGFRHVIVIEC